MKRLEIFAWSILGALVVYFAYLLTKNNFQFADIKNTLADHSHFFSYVSVLVAVLGICIALVAYNQSIKQPEFKVTVVNEQGEYSETMGGNLFLERYSNDEIRYSFSVPTTWRLKITNTGERSAKNIVVKLLFNNISFESEYVYDFTLSHHQRGIGGYQGLIYDEVELILPGESIALPYLPLMGQGHINNAFENSAQISNSEMIVQIYSDDVKKYSKKYSIDIVNPQHGEFEIEYNGYKKFGDILKKVNSNEYSVFTDVNYPVDIPKSIIDTDVKFAYYFCLGKINSKKAEQMTQYTLWFGREYYNRLFNDAKLSEEKIKNDILTTKTSSHKN